MLKAHLRDRLGGLAGGDPLSWRTAAAREADVLTSAVLERLAYLSPGVAWKILSLACEPLGDDAFPVPPVKDPVWSFWPKWEPDTREPAWKGTGPDVSIELPELALVLASERTAAAWESLARAARRGISRPRRVFLVSLDDASLLRTLARDLQREQVGCFNLAWDRMPAATESVRRSGHLHAGHLEVLRDIEAALAERGYRPRVPFSSLPGATSPARPASDSVDGWRPVRRRRAPYGFATFDPVSIATDASALLTWRVS